MKVNSPWRQLLKSVLVVIWLVLINFTSPSTYRSIERWIDGFAVQVFPIKASDAIVVLDITSSDLDKYFGRAHNPLDPAILQRIIEQIASARPSVIAVDIDTAHVIYSRLSEILWGANIVWARGATPDRIHSDQWILDKFLGGNEKSVTVNSGLAFLIDDPDDGRTRSYEKAVEIAPGKLVPTFQSQTAKAFLHSHGRSYDESNPTTPRSIEFRDPKTRLTLPVSLVLEDRHDGVRWRDYVADRIVLLGGTYDYADRHQTSFGEMAGVHVLANAIDTELDGGGRLRLGTFWIISVLLVVLFAQGFVIENINDKPPWLSKCKIFFLLVAPIAIISVILSVFGWSGSIITIVSTWLVMLSVQLFNELVIERVNKWLFRSNNRNAENGVEEQDR